MGIYLNPNNQNFYEAVNKEIYVDKSLLIERVEYLRKKVNKYICVSRPRRFGKSTDANMLVAYYSKGCDSSDIFNDLKISQTELYQKHLNKHNVIHLDIQKFLSVNDSIQEMIKDINESILFELIEEYGDIKFIRKDVLSRVLSQIFAYTNESFIFIIDEWDCIFREYKEDK